MQILQRLLEAGGAEASLTVHGELHQSIASQPHHPSRLQQGDVGIPTAENDTITGTLQTAGGHQSHQIAERSACGEDTSGLLRQPQSLSEPVAELSLKTGQPRGQLFGQQVVVQAGTNQIRCNRSGERRWIKMGQRPGVGWLVGAVHDDLQVVQQGRHIASLITRDQLRLGTDHRNGWTLRGRADPLAEQIAHLMQKVAEDRIWMLGRGEG